MNRRLEDQAIILKAISDVRKEFRGRQAHGQTSIHLCPVLDRLFNLYCLLDVERLAKIVEENDQRGTFEKKESA